MLGHDSVNRIFATLCALILIAFSYVPLLAISEDLFRNLGISLAPHYAYGALFILLPSTAFVLCKKYETVQILLTFLIVGSIAALGHASWDIIWSAIGDAKVSIPIASETRAPNELASGSVDSATPSNDRKSNLVATGEVRELPNIYQIVVDEYSRSDQLLDLLGYDNSTFLVALERRDYRRLTGARSNYPYTLFSLTSMFSMRYLYTDDAASKKSPDLSIVGHINPAIRTFQALGYQYGYIGSNMLGGTQCADEPGVVCLTRNRRMVSTRSLEILSALLRMTPLSYFVSIHSTKGLVTSVDDVLAVAQSHNLETPLFIFAHTLSPHAPYTTRADCSEQPTLQLYLSGGADPTKYIEARECVNRRVLTFVDYLAKNDPDAIVIIHSDHGGDVPLTVENWFLSEIGAVLVGFNG